MYTDQSILNFGKYKFYRICNIPAAYLLMIYEHKYPDKELMQYIEKNLEAILAKKKEVIISKLKFTCSKLTYSSENDAKYALRTIKEKNQEHKKPVRAYECEKCSGWHLTSIPFESWKKINC